MTGDFRRPALVLDEKRARRNIHRMAEKARQSGVRFRPHFKTHQSAEVGEFFREEGVSAITVSSVDMALYFADHGWRDITIAFSFNLLQMEEIQDLAAKINLDLLVESEESVDYLNRHLKFQTGVWIKVDVGYHRTGIPAERPEEVAGLASGIEASGNMTFRGLLTHSGHSYHAGSRRELEEIHRDTVLKLNRIRDFLRAGGIGGCEISVGDTPTCSIMSEFKGVDEIRPGNFVFYDITQMEIGSCTQGDIAVAVACPVVAKHREREEIVIYGGAVHLSKDSLTLGDGRVIFGLVASGEERGWGPPVPDTFVSSLTQEHGIVRTGRDFFDRVAVGDILFVLPVHSCLTVDLLREFHSFT